MLLSPSTTIMAELKVMWGITEVSPTERSYRKAGRYLLLSSSPEVFSLLFSAQRDNFRI
jgi:hypothetical protein